MKMPKPMFDFLNEHVENVFVTVTNNDRELICKYLNGELANRNMLSAWRLVRLQSSNPDDHLEKLGQMRTVPYLGANIIDHFNANDLTDDNIRTALNRIRSRMLVTFGG